MSSEMYKLVWIALDACPHLGTIVHFYRSVWGDAFLKQEYI